ncbi:MAG: hypothetical protein KJ646_00370 [Nanoarchaeota archaeon]|nr:hypothetical protein [Nanoarchaeota archaeon]MBU4116343.1 hypothetical protein [Nanoarchaeota archaeon]
MKWEDVKPLWEKVLNTIQEDRSKLNRAVSDGGAKGRKVTALRIEQATGNHLFDDCPELFGITKYEGHMLREYIHKAAHSGYEYVELFHREFPEIMDSECPRYLKDYVNPLRKSIGLPPLEL